MTAMPSGELGLRRMLQILGFPGDPLLEAF